MLIKKPKHTALKEGVVCPACDGVCYAVGYCGPNRDYEPLRKTLCETCAGFGMIEVTNDTKKP